MDAAHPGARRAPRQVKCPRCGGAALFSPDNPWRPFCSERCKLIDLGQWANEGYRIPVEAQDRGLDLPEN
jgi:endogenous inhibitor of DNA gyrase (YacG/DUF329 family)